MDINDAIDRYFQYLMVEKGATKDTITSYSYDLKQFFLAFPDKVDTNDILPSDISDFMKIQNKKQLSTSTILRRLSVTKNFYKFLQNFS